MADLQLFILLIAFTATVDCNIVKNGATFIEVGSYDVNSTVMKHYYLNKIATTWAKAQELCIVAGLNPINIVTKAEESFLFDLMAKSAQFDLDQDFYIGGAKFGNTWFWINTFKPIDFEMKWRQGEPNNASGNEVCLALSKPQPNSVGFNDGHCGTKNVREHPFMCEKVVVETNSLIDLRFNA